MPKIKYQEQTFHPSSLRLIEICNAVIAEYLAQGFVLTLRQLYYQLVSRDIIPNKQPEYKRLGSIVNDARLAGLIDWNSIEDRTRNLRSLGHWDTPQSIVSSAAEQYRLDMWAGQEWRPEVWIEKDALLGVIEGVCGEFDVPFFSCRGYTSQSEMWAASVRLLRYGEAGQVPIIFHLGDHDPSGKDMTRDIRDRMEIFMGGIKLDRLALNMDQIDQYRPPPNPAKTKDSRYAGYIAEFGEESWELDALEPKVIAALIRVAVQGLIKGHAWKKSLAKAEKTRAQLNQVAARWDDIQTVISRHQGRQKYSGTSSADNPQSQIQNSKLQTGGAS